MVNAMKWGTGQVSQIKTVADEFMQAWGLTRREPIPQGPQEAGNSPGPVSNTSDWRTAGADVTAAITTAGSQLINQVKGLFGLGYGAAGGQPVFGITHELEPTVKYGLLAAGAVIVVLLLMGRKK